MNLLKETIRAIKDSGHTESDVVFIGSENSGHQCTWEEFTKLADIEYDANGTEIASDLIIGFDDGTKLGREDGEWWEFDTPYDIPEVSQPIVKLHKKRDSRLADINK